MANGPAEEHVLLSLFAFVPLHHAAKLWQDVVFVVNLHDRPLLPLRTAVKRREPARPVAAAEGVALLPSVCLVQRRPTVLGHGTGEVISTALLTRVTVVVVEVERGRRVERRRRGGHSDPMVWSLQDGGDDSRRCWRRRRRRRRRQRRW